MFLCFIKNAIFLDFLFDNSSYLIFYNIIYFVMIYFIIRDILIMIHVFYYLYKKLE